MIKRTASPSRIPAEFLMKRLALISVCSIAVIAAASAAAGPQSPTRIPEVPHPGCRVYPTSVTETIADSAGGRTVMTYSQRFDEKTLQTTQDYTLSSTQGSRLSFQQRTTYASLADFIKEGTHAPPFPLYRSMVQTGAINMSVQATYDKSDRQLQTITNRQPGGSQTITNTAWDKDGRPTAGTISGAGAGSTFTYVYDDKARTQTHTVVTGPLTAILVTTFDADANAISRSSRGGSMSSTTTIEIHGRASQCFIDQPPPAMPRGTGSPSPGIPSNGSVTASIGGQSFTSTGVKGSVMDVMQPGKDPKVARILSVGASNQDFILSISVTMTDGPGTYDVELKMNPDPKQPPRGTATGMLMDNRTHGGWAANVATGRGTVTVTSLSSNSASGSFNLVLDATPGTPASGSRSVSGTFNIKF